MRSARRLVSFALGLASLWTAQALAQSSGGPAATMRSSVDRQRLFPPWQKGWNNDVQPRGVEFTVPEVDVLADFHGDPQDAKLVLYVGGNYFFVMAPLVEAFEADHPDYRGRIFWETLPPGILEKQLKAGGAITVGNMILTVKPDAYFAGLEKIKDLLADGDLVGSAVPYVTNTLTIMIPKGNPAHIKTLMDLGRPDVRLVMPNPESEGVVRQIKISLAKAGGDALVETVYGAKVRTGATLVTEIHHRQTPLFLMQGRADAGVTWKSEAIFQEQAGLPIYHVDIPADQNATGVYAGAVAKGAVHAEAAKIWLDYIKSPRALEIFAGYGFLPYRPN